MCLATVYLNKWSSKPLIQDIVHMQIHSNQVKIETLFGEEEVIPGRVAEIDFATSKILINERHDSKKA